MEYVIIGGGLIIMTFFILGYLILKGEYDLKKI